MNFPIRLLAVAAFLAMLPAKAQVYQASGGINEYSATTGAALASAPAANGGVTRNP
jgi:hypothetical protein